MKNLLFTLLALATWFSGAQTTFAQNSKSIVLCETYNSGDGTPSGVGTSWDIDKSTGGNVYVVYRNGSSKITENLLLYVDKLNSSSKYVAYATENLSLGANKKWAMFDFKFTESGKYKLSAVTPTGSTLASVYADINYKNSYSTSDNDDNSSSIYESLQLSDNSSSSSGKSIVLCESYNDYGKATGIYSTWNIKSVGGFVYILYNNNGKNIKNTLWLYVDKKNENGKYVPFETKTFDINKNKSWSAYDFKFTETGNYKISAVSSNGEEAVTYATIKLADGEKEKTEKTIVTCESYDDYGKPVGKGNEWDITADKGYVYILFDNGEPITNSVSLFIDKKNAKGEYAIYDTKTFETSDSKDWSVYDYKFKEGGDYKLSAYSNGEYVATTFVKMNYKTSSSSTTSTSSTKDKVDTWYYENSTVSFADNADANGKMSNSNTTFFLSGGKKSIAVVYKDAKAIKTTKVYMDVYSIGTDNQEDFIETITLYTSATQKVCVGNYTFKNSGTYKVSFYNADNIFMNMGYVTVLGSISESTTKYTNTNSGSSTQTYLNSLMLPESSTSDNNPRVALVIGNGNYVSSGTLPNPVHDAEEMSKALKNCGFTVTTVINGNKKQMNEAVNKFGQMLSSNKNATGMVYYAGHGIQSKGENYIIPIDAEIGVEEDLQYECLNVGKILAKMEAAKNPINIIALDACRNNPFERSWNRSTSNGNGLTGMNAPEGTIISFSTNPGNVASDGDGYNSPYTTAFLNQLKKSGLSIEQVLKGVAAEVKKNQPGQLPWYSSSIVGEFYFRAK